MTPRYFALRDHIDPGRPLAAHGCTVALPRMRGDHVGMEPTVVDLRPHAARDDRLPGRILPGSRIVEATNPILAAAMEQSASFVECAPPRELQSRTDGTVKNATGRKARTGQTAEEG